MAWLWKQIAAICVQLRGYRDAGFAEGVDRQNQIGGEILPGWCSGSSRLDVPQKN
jgi:hypothetical protein